MTNIIDKAVPNPNFDVKLAFIDAGMVTRLGQKDQENFFKLTWSVIQRDATACT